MSSSNQTDLAHIELLLDVMHMAKDHNWTLPQFIEIVEKQKTWMTSQPKTSGANSNSSSICSDGNGPVSLIPSYPKARCPSALRQTSMPPCKNPSCNSLDVEEDAGAGSVVCTQCGLIQVTSVFENATTYAVFHGGVSRTAAHRYSRIPILRGILLSLQGETRVVLEDGEKEMLLSFFQGGAPPANAIMVKRAIRMLDLPRRLMHHATTIWYQLWRGFTPNPSEKEIRQVLRLFHALENVWDRLPLASFVRKGRKKFLSFPVTWKFLCEELNLESLGSIMDELQIKNKKNITAQRKTLSILLSMSRK